MPNAIAVATRSLARPIEIEALNDVNSGNRLHTSRKQLDRKPSHFGSWDAPGGIDDTDFDSIGDAGESTGTFIAGHSRPAAAS